MLKMLKRVECVEIPKELYAKIRQILDTPEDGNEVTKATLLLYRENNNYEGTALYTAECGRIIDAIVRGKTFEIDGTCMLKAEDVFE